MKNNRIPESMPALMLPLLLISFSSTGAPYDSVGFALRQQVMVNDLRSQCRISLAVSDEKIRSTFMPDVDNHQTLIRAADALKSGNRTQYAQSLADIRCPSLSP